MVVSLLLIVVVSGGQYDVEEELEQLAIFFEIFDLAFRPVLAVTFFRLLCVSLELCDISLLSEAAEVFRFVVFVAGDFSVVVLIVSFACVRLMLWPCNCRRSPEPPELSRSR